MKIPRSGSTILSASRGVYDLLHRGHIYPLLSSCWLPQGASRLRVCLHVACLYRTHIAQARINDAMHLCNSPLHDIAEVFVVDIEVLPAHRTLCPFFEFVLAVTNKETDQALS